MSFRSKGPRTVLPFGLDYSDVLSSNYDVEKPKLILPINAPLSHQEQQQAAQSINLSKLVLDGPFFTGNSLDDNQKTTSLTLADGIERHSDKYKKIKKIGTTIEDFPLNVEYFPSELYPVMGVSKKRKNIGLSSYKSSHELGDHQALQESHAETKNNSDAAAILQNLESMAEDYDGKNDNKDDEDDEEGEDVEEQDDYEDDEDDDYNAERYFDDGDEDFGDNNDEEAAF